MTQMLSSFFLKKTHPRKILSPGLSFTKHLLYFAPIIRVRLKTNTFSTVRCTISNWNCFSKGCGVVVENLKVHFIATYLQHRVQKFVEMETVII